MPDPNLDPIAQPKPDRQFWDYEPVPEEQDNAKLPLTAEERAARRRQRYQALRSALVASSFAVCFLLFAAILRQNHQLRDESAITTQTVIRLTETLVTQEQRIRELERFDEETLDYMSDLDAQVAAISK